MTESGRKRTLKRNECREDSGRFITIDNLILGYRGNRLLKVTEKGDACTATGATDFYDGANTSVEYSYDACGARTSDANKGIASIRYSYWGTPELIQFTNGSQTRYVYDASGVKQKRIHITAVDNIVVPLKTVMELSDDQILTTAPTYITLAHELFHAEDFVKNGNRKSKTWIVLPDTKKRISYKEYETCIKENLIRKENKLPLRKYYVKDSNGVPYEPSLILRK